MTSDELWRTVYEKELEWWEQNFEEACQNVKIDCAKLAEMYFNDAGIQKKYTISEFILDKNREV